MAINGWWLGVALWPWNPPYFNMMKFMELPNSPKSGHFFRPRFEPCSGGTPGSERSTSTKRPWILHKTRGEKHGDTENIGDDPPRQKGECRESSKWWRDAIPITWYYHMNHEHIFNKLPWKHVKTGLRTSISYYKPSWATMNHRCIEWFDTKTHRWFVWKGCRFNALLGPGRPWSDHLWQETETAGGAKWSSGASDKVDDQCQHFFLNLALLEYP